MTTGAWSGVELTLMAYNPIETGLLVTTVPVSLHCFPFVP